MLCVKIIMAQSFKPSVIKANYKVKIYSKLGDDKSEDHSLELQRIIYHQEELSQNLLITAVSNLYYKL